MVAKIEEDVRAELGTAHAELEKKVVALRAELANVSKALAAAKEQITVLEEKNERLNEIKDEKTVSRRDVASACCAGVGCRDIVVLF
jgi:multidrug resistance efflux pump